ncbi:O-antigen ligase family protein, partial [Candidatus Pelagibacter ubique]|nr:O-antigen ligase family protein [Candidatus Pelagibacter ubique]
SYLSRFFPILFGLFVLINKKMKVKNDKLLFLITVIFILAEGLILLSGERLALFFMNLSAIYIILMIKDYRIYRLWTYIGSLTLMFLILFFVSGAKNRIIDQTINDFYGKNIEEDKFYIFSKPHNDMYTSGIKIFYDNKFFGVGPRQFRNECKGYEVSEYSCETHPHNTYIELLSEAGIFAFLIVAILFSLITFFSFKHFFLRIFNSKKILFDDFQVCMISAIIISLWPFSPSGSFFNNWMSIVYYYPIGMFLWSIHRVHKTD